MKSFSLKLSNKGPVSRTTFPAFWLIQRELRQHWGTGHLKTKMIAVLENYGIRNTLVSDRVKARFKKDMREIERLFPDMPTPFSGHIQFIENGTILNELRFVPRGLIT